jgi:hypothetical protein
LDETKNEFLNTTRILERKKEKDEEDRIRWDSGRKVEKEGILAELSSGPKLNLGKLITKE